MRNRAVGFVGGGRVTGIILDALRRCGAMPASVVVSDPAEGVLARLKERHPGIAVSAENAKAASQDIVFLSLHPPMIPEALPKIASSLKPDAMVVSLAPKFTLGKLSVLLGGFQRLARVIPTATSIIGAGLNPICYSSSLSPAERMILADVLGGLGELPEVAEEKLEAYAVLVAMGPTYLWFQLAELMSLGRSFGLTGAESAEAIEKMTVGAVRTLTQSGLSVDQVKDLVPVKPLAELEAAWVEAYQSKLTGIFQKIKP